METYHKSQPTDEVIKSRYYPNTDVFQAVSKPSDSWLWNSWREAAQLIKRAAGGRSAMEAQSRCGRMIWFLRVH